VKITRKPNTQNRAPLLCLVGQPALKLRLNASSKRDGSEWAWGRKRCSNSRGCGMSTRARSTLPLLMYVDVAADCPVEVPAWLMGLCEFLALWDAVIL